MGFSPTYFALIGAKAHDKIEFEFIPRPEGQGNVNAPLHAFV